MRLKFQGQQPWNRMFSRFSRLSPGSTIRFFAGAIFVELNVGSGTLTAAVKYMGVRMQPRNNPEPGGTDVFDPVQAWVLVRMGKTTGSRLAIDHTFRCSSMTTARQRSLTTKVRIAEEPWGIQGLPPRQAAHGEDGSNQAVARDRLTWQAHEILRAHVSVENPDALFIWKLGLLNWPGKLEARFSSWMLGGDINKPTCVISLCISLPSLQPRCFWYPSKGAFT